MDEKNPVGLDDVMSQLFGGAIQNKIKSNIRQNKKGVYIELDFPGVKKEDINIDIQGNKITISGEKKLKKDIVEKDYSTLESKYGLIERSFLLPETADIKNIDANSKNGVLEIFIPVIKKEDATKIKVK